MQMCNRRLGGMYVKAVVTVDCGLNVLFYTISKVKTKYESLIPITLRLQRCSLCESVADESQ